MKVERTLPKTCLNTDMAVGFSQRVPRGNPVSILLKEGARVHLRTAITRVKTGFRGIHSFGLCASPGQALGPEQVRG